MRGEWSILAKKLTQAQIRKALSAFSKAELIDIICKLCKSSKESADQVNLMLGNDGFVDDVLEETKRKVHNQFFTKRGMGRLSLSKAKSDIAAFKKICNDPAKLIDLQLYYVECGIEFTNAYGDISESFYNSMGGMYEKVVNSLIESRDVDMIRRFEPRLSKAVDDTEYIGWGFGDWLAECYHELKTAIGDEEE